MPTPTRAPPAARGGAPAVGRARAQRSARARTRTRTRRSRARACPPPPGDGAPSLLDGCALDWSRHHAQVLLVEAGAHGVRARLAEALLHRHAAWLSHDNVLLPHACGVGRSDAAARDGVATASAGPAAAPSAASSAAASSAASTSSASTAVDADSPELALRRAALLGEASRLGLDARSFLSRPRALWNPPRARQDLLSNVLHPAVVGDLDAHELIVCLDAEARELCLACAHPRGARPSYEPTVRTLGEFAPVGAEAVRRAARGQVGPGPLVPPLDDATAAQLVADGEARLAAAEEAWRGGGAAGVAAADPSDLEAWQRMVDALLVATLGVAVFAVESFQSADVPDYDPL